MKYKYVNVYRVNQMYGGPEEGGWWYDVGEIQKVMPVPQSKGSTLLTKVGRWCDRMNEGTRPRYSVIGTSDWTCSLSDKAGTDYPEETPFYE